MNAQPSVLKWLISLRSSTREANWEELYRAELPHVYNFFRYRVGDGPLAEDLTSTTFEKAWRFRHQYRRETAAFSTWLFGIARNVAIDYFRRNRTHVSLDEACEVADQDSLEETALRRLQFRRLLHLMRQLPDRERDLLALKYGSGMSNREIAQVTKLSESNIGTILHRTIRLLRAQWDEGKKIHG
jgi:RNA polymerase sigma-70 factor, ECF subfamily